jgi:hypothetical protein
MATITTAAIAAIAQMINNSASINPFTYMATGSGSGAESANSTALGTENTLYQSGRAQSTCTYAATGISQWVNLFQINGGTVTIQEIGLFNAASNGVMLLRHVLSAPKTYGSGESVQITITTTIAAV